MVARPDFRFLILDFKFCDLGLKTENPTSFKASRVLNI
jgi:hypothetical protein